MRTSGGSSSERSWGRSKGSAPAPALLDIPPPLFMRAAARPSPRGERPWLPCPCARRRSLFACRPHHPAAARPPSRGAPPWRPLPRHGPKAAPARRSSTHVSRRQCAAGVGRLPVYHGPLRPGPHARAGLATRPLLLPAAPCAPAGRPATQPRPPCLAPVHQPPLLRWPRRSHAPPSQLIPFPWECLRWPPHSPTFRHGFLPVHAAGFLKDPPEYGESIVLLWGANSADSKCEQAGSAWYNEVNVSVVSSSHNRE